MTKADVQIRGICQCCGAQQAVVGNTMSYHGYTTKNGWFEGTCPGHQFRPLQVDRTVLDNTVDSILRQVAALRIKAEDMQAGKTTPEHIVRRGKLIGSKREQIKVAFEEGTAAEKHDALNSAIYMALHRANQGERMAADLKGLADKFHGTALVEVEREDKTASKPEAIAIGEERVYRGRTVRAAEAKGANVFVNLGGGAQMKISKQAWRKLPKA